MTRILHLSIQTIVQDPESAGLRLLHALSARRRMRLSGICDIGETLTAVLEEDPSAQIPVRCVFSPFTDSSEDSVAADVVARYQAGFSTAGSFRAPDGTLWGLFLLPSAFSAAGRRKKEQEAQSPVQGALRFSGKTEE